jgi:hypothetical protein
MEVINKCFYCDNNPTDFNNEQIIFDNDKFNKILNNQNTFIKELKINDKKQFIEIEELKIDNQKKSIEIEELKTEIKELKFEIKEMKNKDLILKIMKVLQDINSSDELEIILSLPYKNYMYKLRNQRNENCHYISKMDSQDVINKKKEYILKYLLTISSEVKQKINKKCGNGLIDEIIKYLSSLKLSYSELSEDEMNDVIEWWD